MNNIFDPWNLENNINISVNGEYIFIGPNIRTFNQLKEIINNVEWINKTIVPQQDTFMAKG